MLKSIGVSVSLTGKYERFGAQALNGLQLWAERAGATLTHYDDASRASIAADNTRRLVEHDRVQMLFGPYSSGLAAVGAKVAEEHHRVLWNHGGASDDVAGRWIVSILSPASDYFRAFPTWLNANAPELRTITVMRSGRGSFAAHVARGLVEAGGVVGLAVEVLPMGAPPPRPRGVLVLAGSFDEEVETLRSRPQAGIVAAVAAGVRSFWDELGPAAEGVIGPSQWEPGPGSESFVQAFQERFGRTPDYVAAGAFAAGLIAQECVARAGWLDDSRLREEAAGLEIQTFYGGFRIDPESGRQLAHRVRLVQWRDGRKIVVG